MPLYSASLTEAAREKFFGRGELPTVELKQPILRSWLRCAELGLDVAKPPRAAALERTELQTFLARHERLRRLCRPELDALNAEAHETGAVVILADAQGVIVDAVGDIGFAAQATEISLRPGAHWSEAAAGTNAIGAALAERRAVAVHGGEHFFESHAILSGAAAPIVDPRGVVVGALALSANAGVHRVHALGLVRFAVEQIEHRFFGGNAFSAATVLRFHTDPAVVGAPREGLLAFDDDKRLIAANRRGLSFVQRDWSALDCVSFDELFEPLRAAPQMAEIIGSDGRRYYGLANTPSSCRARPTDCPLELHDICFEPLSARLAEHRLRDAELSAMRAALDACDGNFSKAARVLGVHRSTLYRRLNERAGERPR
ncbi:GAF domain-containing protein [Methylosinus sporium]|uniref:GAF domain-containing protein n=1 Tax=Methylosinus sporium TaxID=428 RepID=A0A549T429_METSR|nr:MULTISPECIES: helix-turn-helix domain-containing protein [Methylosinus]MBU3889206.1 GAF domain-containing protein [Methylosinus sp. KRF6]TRL36665.1 GAF domain-containing protein [Methylosinus sporium]